jgi:hypothetical protein
MSKVTREELWWWVSAVGMGVLLSLLLTNCGRGW